MNIFFSYLPEYKKSGRHVNKIFFRMESPGHRAENKRALSDSVRVEMGPEEQQSRRRKLVPEALTRSVYTYLLKCAWVGSWVHREVSFYKDSGKGAQWRAYE